MQITLHSRSTITSEDRGDKLVLRAWERPNTKPFDLTGKQTTLLMRSGDTGIEITPDIEAPADEGILSHLWIPGETALPGIYTMQLVVAGGGATVSSRLKGAPKLVIEPGIFDDNPTIIVPAEHGRTQVWMGQTPIDQKSIIWDAATNTWVPGPAADAHARLNFTSTTSIQWQHNLNKFASITVIDLSGADITSGVSIEHIDENTILVETDFAISGNLYAN